MIRLDCTQRDIILSHFERSQTLASAHSWSRRQYAPMHIHRPEFRSVREQLLDRWPDHVVAFDVVFEAPAATPVAFHSDYESLGPFEYAPYRSIRDHDFVSVHFNLTPGGGRLRTLDWPRLSWLHHVAIVRFGIYSAAHRALNWLCAPLFWAFAHTYPNDVGAGNAFDNLRLHGITAGASRVSFVVRMVRSGVSVTQASVLGSVRRSPACERLAHVLLPALRPRMRASDVRWERLQD